MNVQEVLNRLGIKDINQGASTGYTWFNTTGDIIESYSPVDGKLIAKVAQGTADDYETIINKAQKTSRCKRSSCYASATNSQLPVTRIYFLLKA